MSDNIFLVLFVIWLILALIVLIATIIRASVIFKEEKIKEDELVGFKRLKFINDLEKANLALRKYYKK